ncbi:MAG: hypothetical protein EOP48_10845 [Sphingobacteriales bacterium]|nr:MAG: hypothetical protein EOP48_10845 [Sphingobacteriales bacterium]
MYSAWLALIAIVFNLTFAQKSIASENNTEYPEVIHNIGGFPSGTLVATSQGNIPIQRLSVGSKVLSFDLETGQIAESKVIDAYSYPQAGAWEIKVNGEKFVINPDHRFYLPSNSSWVEARNLKPGDTVLLKSGQQVAIESSLAIRSNVPMYEITVEKNSNYFVGNSGVLVHNFFIAIPVATWVIGEGIVWASAATIAVIAALYIIMEQSKPSSKYCDGADNIDLSKFKPGKKNGKTVLLEPKSGHYLDDNIGTPHGGSEYKLKDQFGNRIGSVTCDGRIIRK